MDKLTFQLVKQVSILSCLCLLISCTSKEEQTETLTVPVSVQTVIYDNNAFPREYIGTVESENSVDVSFLVPGNIEQMYVSEGQKVTKGQLLARLNTASLKNTHIAAMATLKQAEDAYKRMSAMYENKSLPEIQYIDVKTKFEQAKSSEAIARKGLQDGNIYAPQSGVIGKRYLEAGANAMPGAPVYNIMDIGSIKVKTAIPEGEISTISVGTKCQVKISALDNEAFEGEIIEKSVSANPISHTYDIKIRVNNPTGKIMPGMVCRTYLRNPENGESIIIPIKAVQVDHSEKRFVWLKDQQNKAVYREVTLGSLLGNGVQIVNGLQTGDELITEGYQNISNGTLVTVK